MRYLALGLGVLLAACGRSATPPADDSGNAIAPTARCTAADDGDIVLAVGDARAVVTRQPYHLRVERNGSTVLANVAQRGGVPLALDSDEPLGSDSLPQTGLYAPLSYTVGGGINLQFPAGPWIGNQLADAAAGIEYAARDVTAARCEGGAALLTLSTDDPTGRQIELRLQPDASGAIGFQLQALVRPALGVSMMSASFDSPAEERFHGFGGRHNAIDQRGHRVVNWLQQSNFSAGPLQPGVDVLPGTGGPDYLFPNGPGAAYYNQALFLSSAGYGFLLENSELSQFRLALDRADAWQVQVNAGELRYAVLPAGAKAALQGLAQVNGRHRVPPAWALGPTLSRTIQILSPNADTAVTYEAKIRADIARIRELDLPVSSYGFEAWQILPEETTRELIAELRSMGIETLLYQRPFVAADIANTEPAANFLSVLAQGHFARTPQGAPYLFGSPFIVGAGGLLDFTQPATVDYWNARLRRMLDTGANGFMQDFGEQVMRDMRFADGSSGAEMHNAYPNLYHRLTREFIDGYQRETGREIFFFTRAGFSGRPGSAAYEGANFPGDETTDWSASAGLASIIPDMLSRAVGGAYGFNTDIGGYADYLTGQTSRELFIRWTQAAALMPIFRVHNSASSGVRLPWDYDQEALRIWTRYAELHQRAAPLILRLWQEAQASGIPPTRPLWLAWPDDPRARAEKQQWLLGDELLVAPVIEPGATTRRVYFPEGCWQHGETAARYQGPAEIVVPAPLDSLPWFRRCGSAAL